jgi:hypothetical protein
MFSGLVVLCSGKACAPAEMTELTACGAPQGLSMELRDTGLSASDRSGNIERFGVDMQETAEWH